MPDSVRPKLPPSLHLVPAGTSDDTIETLEHLLAEAKAGRLVGLVYAGLYRRQQYFVDATGECHRNPTFTLGMVSVLHNEITARIRGD